MVTVSPGPKLELGEKSSDWNERESPEGPVDVGITSVTQCDGGVKSIVVHLPQSTHDTELVRFSSSIAGEAIAEPSESAIRATNAATLKAIDV